MSRLLAVGYALGPVHLVPGGPVDHHAVRVGWDTHRLADADRVDVWRACHGSPGGGPATRDTVVTAGVPDAPAHLDALLAAGLVVEVPDDDPVDVARTHRVQPLLSGLGNSSDDVLDSLGLVGLPPAARVRPRVSEVWRWAHLWPDLWSAAVGFASLGGGGSAPRPTAEEELPGLLTAVAELLGAGAVYLDVARGGRPTRRHELPPLR